MQRLIDKYARKLVTCGLCDPEGVLLGGLDAELAWSGDGPAREVLEEVVAGLNINSILLARPRGFLAPLVDRLARRALAGSGRVAPEDSESRTFLHDIPVIGQFRATPIIAALKRRKNVLIPGRGVVTFGVVSPEQAFVHFSSVCFALFVKFCGDYLAARRRGENDGEEEEIMAGLVAYYEDLLARARDYPPPAAGPYRDREETLAAITAAGKATVACGMVDSFFGNVSYLLEDTIYITQTTSSLDELAGCIDACPLDGSSCVGITASSEYTAHREVLEKSSRRAILHGHPRFAVILSMICDVPDCPGRGNCHRVCHRERRAGTIPIAPGEPGTGRYGLATTMPPYLKEHPGVIIYGHGIFTASDTGLDEAFRTLVETEEWCFRDYLRLAGR